MRIYLNHSSGMFFLSPTTNPPTTEPTARHPPCVSRTHKQIISRSVFGLSLLDPSHQSPLAGSSRSLQLKSIRIVRESGAARRDALRRSLLFTRTMGKIIVCSWFYLVDRTVITILTALCFYSFLANRTQQSSMEMLAKWIDAKLKEGARSHSRHYL